MSSIGHPDYQGFPQWLGHPFVANAALALGAGTHTDGPFTVSNFASIILAIAPTTHGVTATITQQISGAPAGLTVVETFNISAGSTLFEAIVLTGNLVTLELQGGGAGTTVAYALYPSNTTTNSAVSSSTVLNFLHNGVAIKAEPGLDVEDAAAVGNPSHSPITWTTTDNAGVSVGYTPVFALGVQHNDAGQVNEAVLDLKDAAAAALPGVPGLTFALTDDSANNRVKVTPTLTAGPRLYSYTEQTSGVAITATSEATAQTVISSNAITFDGATKVRVTFYAIAWRNASANAVECFMVLSDSVAGVLGTVADENITEATAGVRHGPISWTRVYTPSSGTRTLSVKAYASTANGFTLPAGAGGSGGTDYPIALTVEALI